MREMYPNSTNISGIDGSSSCWKMSTGLASGTDDETGNQPRCTAKITITKVPTTNSGRATNERPVMVMMRSAAPP